MLWGTLLCDSNLIGETYSLDGWWHTMKIPRPLASEWLKLSGMPKVSFLFHGTRATGITEMFSFERTQNPLHHTEQMHD